MLVNSFHICFPKKHVHKKSFCPEKRTELSKEFQYFKNGTFGSVRIGPKFQNVFWSTFLYRGKFSGPSCQNFLVQVFFVDPCFQAKHYRLQFVVTREPRSLNVEKFISDMYGTSDHLVHVDLSSRVSNVKLISVNWMDLNSNIWI